MMSAFACGRIFKSRARLLLSVAAAIAAFTALTMAAPPAHAMTPITRAEIVSRAYSALDTPYAQQGVHIKSYQPDESFNEGKQNCGDEPYIDCSGLLQKSWQVPDQMYPGEVPSLQYNAKTFYSCGTGLWYEIPKSSLQRGDALVSTGHATVFLGTWNGQWWVIEAAGTATGTVCRPFPYNSSSYKAIRRANIEGDVLTGVRLDNPTAWQTGGSVTYGCPHFCDWSKSTYIQGYSGIDYQYHMGTATSRTPAIMRYTPYIPQTGYYYVYIGIPCYPNFANSVLVGVTDLAGTDWGYMDESAGWGQSLVYLGRHRFAANWNPAAGCVTVSTWHAPTNKAVTTDCVYFAYAGS
jgi:hypothetical protein